MVLGFTDNSYSNSLNLSLPGAPQNYSSDKFRAGDLDCSNAIGSATNLEFGVTGIIKKDDSIISNSIGTDDQVNNIGVYGRIIIPLGSKVKSRINCNRLYELEIKKKELELQKLQQEVQNLKSLKFEN